MTTTDTRPNVEYGDAAAAYAGEILRTTVGSEVHGIATGNDDHDEMGVYIEPQSYVVGLSSWSYPRPVPRDEARCPARDTLDDARCVKGMHDSGLHDFRLPGPGHATIGYQTGQGMPHFIWRTQPEGGRSGPGDIDRSLYSLRKYLRLAVNGNPTALLPLFAPESDVLICNDLGWQLRDLRQSFLSTQAAERFLSYMDRQHERMLGRGRQSAVPNRPELVERYGWDVKYGSHALRLAYQGRELVMEGTLTLPMRPEERARVVAVKTGQVPQGEVSGEIGVIEAGLRAVLDSGHSALPDAPELDVLSRWSEQAHLVHWQRTR